MKKKSNVYSDWEVLLLDKPKEQKESCETQRKNKISFGGAWSSEGERILGLSFKPQMLHGEILEINLFAAKILFRMFNIVISISRLSRSFDMGSVPGIYLVVIYDGKMGYSWDSKTLFYKGKEYTIAEFETAFDVEIKIKKAT